MKQQQFLEVVSEAEARARLQTLISNYQVAVERIKLDEACLGRVLASSVRTQVDVPAFDRSNVDGFAVRASDTFGAEEVTPIRLKLSDQSLPAGAWTASVALDPGQAMYVATGGVIPRHADAVVMIEDTEISESEGQAFLEVSRAIAPGAHITWAGTDLGKGEVVLQRGCLLNSKATGLLAAIGTEFVEVIRPPHVAVLSTGDEIIPPGQTLKTGQIFDSNSRIVLDAAREAGATTEFLGILPDHRQALKDCLIATLTRPTPPDWLVLSGGTSKGRGDLNASVVAEIAAEQPGCRGLLVHGVALKPGKPLGFAELYQRAVILLPGFPTSAIFTFHEFIVPSLRQQAGLAAEEASLIEAKLPFRLNSVAGRTQYSLVNLIPSKTGLKAYPQGSGSGSVSSFSRADGYLRIPQHTEYLDPDTPVSIKLFAPNLALADLNIIGSHCLGLDWLVEQLAQEGFRIRSMHVGSTAGCQALGRGEGEIAGIHLLDAQSGRYNQDFVPDNCQLIAGYTRTQGFLLGSGHEELARLPREELMEILKSDGLRMINRNQGSGTRILLDQCLAGARPPGYQHQAKSHNAVAAAVMQGRSDWGMTLKSLVTGTKLGFVPYIDEHFDFLIRKDQLQKPAVKAFLATLQSESGTTALKKLGFLRRSSGASSL